MLVVFLICGQITLLSYQNQMLQDAAIEAAMFGALADQNATAAETKAKELFQAATVEVSAVNGQSLSVRLTLDSVVRLEAVGLAVFENAIR